MYPKLLHIYGSLYIQSYGVCIALGITLFGWLIFKDPRRRALVTKDQFHTLIMIGILSGVIGGRLLYFFTEGRFTTVFDFFEFWQGGFAVLGSLLGVLATIPWFLKKYSIPIVPVLDCVALYAPLLQSISRIGCFLAGCCYGKETLVSWAITYTNHECMAPLNIPLHPTQLYSALALGLIFCFLYFMQRFIKRDGQLLALYLILMGFERFFIDFFRDDQTYFSNKFSYFSDHQCIAFMIMFCAALYLVTRPQRSQKYVVGAEA